MRVQPPWPCLQRCCSATRLTRSSMGLCTVLGTGLCRPDLFLRGGVVEEHKKSGKEEVLVYQTLSGGLGAIASKQAGKGGVTGIR